MSNLKLIYLILPLIALFSGCSNHQSKVDYTETEDEIVLKNAIKAECLIDGELIKDPSTGEVYYQKLSVKHPDKVVRFYGNMTYSFVDGSKSGGWKCDGLSTINGSEQQNEQDAGILEDNAILESNGGEVDPNYYGTQNNSGEVAPSSNEGQKQWVNCSACHGNGIVSCYRCVGKGSYTCESCHGRGEDRYGICNNCRGGGIEKCYECYGRGNKGNCESCGGRGQVQE